MKKYIVNISGTSQFLGDPTFFIGTDFMGAEFETFEELQDLMKKYATYEKADGRRYWRPEVRLTFSLSSSVEEFRAEGDRQCKENGRVNLISAALGLLKDPFYGIEIIWRRGGWVDYEGNIFKLILIKGKQHYPQYNKTVREVIREIGLDI